MKKVTLTLVALFILTATMVQAQNFAIGTKVGTNITKITGQSFTDKFEYGYHAGGYINLKLSKKLVLQPEVLMSQINTSVDSNFNHLYNNLSNVNYLKNIQLKYLTIPVVVNYKLSKNTAIQGGVQYAKLLESNQTLLQNGQNAFKDGDFSVLAGIQFKLRKVTVSGRYLIGLNNLNDINYSSQWKSQTAQISLGYRIF